MGRPSASDMSLKMAREVLGVDGSEKAIMLARANAELNGVANVRFEVSDAFERLQSLHSLCSQFSATT